MREDERIPLDAYHIFKANPSSDIFGEKYLEELRATILRTQGWPIKIGLAQVPAYIYLFVSMSVSVPGFSLYGVTLGDIPGLKECLLLYMSILGLANSLLQSAAEFRNNVYNHLIKVKYQSDEVQFFKLLTPYTYYAEVRMPDSSDHFVLQKGQFKWPHIMIGLALALCVITVAIIMFSAQIYIVISIIKHPGIPIFYETVICGMAVAMPVIAFTWRMYEKKRYVYEPKLTIEALKSPAVKPSSNVIKVLLFKFFGLSHR